MPPTASAPARRVCDGDNAPAGSHHSRCLKRAEQQGGGLGVDGGAPVLRREFQNGLIEVLHVGAGIGDEDVQRAQPRRACLGEHPRNILGPRHVG